MRLRYDRRRGRELARMVSAASIIPENELQALLRILVAAIAGGAVGWNRQMAGKPAGLRTHMLVSLGSTLFVLIPLLVADVHAADTLARTIQGIAAGIGFLGAGEILHETRPNPGTPMVHGLTSAAAIWVTAAIGVAAGCGLWKLTLAAAVLTLIILTIAQRIERLPRFAKSHEHTADHT